VGSLVGGAGGAGGSPSVARRAPELPRPDGPWCL